MPTEFQDKVYEILKKVPKGRVVTYKILAEALGCKAYQAVGTAMRINPYAPFVPCHRVVKSDGSIGYFKGKNTYAAMNEKRIMLENEGVKVRENKIVDFDVVLYRVENFKK